MCSLTTSVFAEAVKKSGEAIFEIKITRNNEKNVEAQIVKIDNKQNSGENGNLPISKKIKIIGQKRQTVKEGKKITDIIWNKVSDEKNVKDLKSPLRSSIIARPKVEKGDQFKAKGDKQDLVDAIMSLGSTDFASASNSRSKQVGNSGDTSSSVAANSSKLSSLSTRPLANSVDSTTTGDVSTPVATTLGCSVRVDYQLNKVFPQQRMVDNGSEVDSCRDTEAYFDLSRDYESCPSVINTAALKTTPYFQYFYNDNNAVKNLIDQCQPDDSKSKSLQITKVACDDYIDLAAGFVYSQEKQYYKDVDGEDVLLTDCAVNRNTSYLISEDKSSCGIRNDFVSGYSVQRSRFFYTKNNQQIEVQSCQDTSTKYVHNSTTDTCSSSTDNGQVTTYTRKYISVDGITTYISDCEPVSGAANIQSENCTTTRFTNDFVSGQSYRNKNYFYIDSVTGRRVEVSSCIKSDEVFLHTKDSAVCVATDNDTTLKTTIFAKTYISVDGAKIYLSECEAVSPEISYTQIGYKWVVDYQSNSSIAASGVGDNVYLGTKQGVVVNNSRYNKTAGYWQDLVNPFNILSYSTVGKCSTPSSINYAGNTIDMTYSDLSTVTYDNYVDQISSPPLCQKYCYQWSLITNSCSSGVSDICQPAYNTQYYQRCTNYKCDITKYIKKPLYRRNNGSEYLNSSESLSTKYTCGQGLSSNPVYY